MSSSHGASRVISIRFPLNLGYGNKAIGDAIIGVKADMADHISSRKLESAFERTIYSYKKHWGGFKVDNMMFDMTPMFYDRLEVKKLILAVDDILLLESIYNENLKYDGSVQRVAQETFVHRNTINYQLAKIKRILGNNLKTFEERFKIILAFEVRDVL